MSKHEQLQSKPPKNFKRLIGVVDLGYLGIKKQHKNIQIPYKSSKLHPLTDAQKTQNKLEASARICVEHVNAKLKTFQILTQKYLIVERGSIYASI